MTAKGEGTLAYIKSRKILYMVTNFWITLKGEVIYRVFIRKIVINAHSVQLQQPLLELIYSITFV